MKTTLLVAAMEEEFDAFVRQLKKHDISCKQEEFSNVKGIVCTINKERIFAFRGEVGKVATAFKLGKLATSLEVRRIINIGTAGSLISSVHPLDVVIATRVAYHDVDLTMFGYKYGQISGSTSPYFEADLRSLKSADKLDSTIPIHLGLILSGDRFATKENLSKEVLASFDNPLCIDMESGAVAQVATEMHIPFIIIRSISDLIDDEDNKVSHEEFLQLSTSRASSVAFHILNSDIIKD